MKSKIKNQKVKKTIELIKDVKGLKELKSKYYTNLKVFCQGAYTKIGDLYTLYSYKTKIMDYNAKTGEIKRYYGLDKQARAKAKELKDDELKAFMRKYWSYTTGIHIIEFSTQFMGEKITKKLFEAIPHVNDLKQEQAKTVEKPTKIVNFKTYQDKQDVIQTKIQPTQQLAIF